MEIYSDYEKIRLVLESLVKETNDRLDLFVKNRVENINEYSQLGKGKMKRIVVFIDELAELMRSTDKESNKAITNALETLTRLSSVSFRLFNPELSQRLDNSGFFTPFV